MCTLVVPYLFFNVCPENKAFHFKQQILITCILYAIAYLWLILQSPCTLSAYIMAVYFWSFLLCCIYLLVYIMTLSSPCCPCVCWLPLPYMLYYLLIVLCLHYVELSLLLIGGSWDGGYDVSLLCNCSINTLSWVSQYSYTDPP